jgi:hypothetical protein
VCARGRCSGRVCNCLRVRGLPRDCTGSCSSFIADAPPKSCHFGTSCVSSSSSSSSSPPPPPTHRSTAFRSARIPRLRRRLQLFRVPTGQLATRRASTGTCATILRANKPFARLGSELSQKPVKKKKTDRNADFLSLAARSTLPTFLPYYNYKLPIAEHRSPLIRLMLARSGLSQSPSDWPLIMLARSHRFLLTINPRP